MPNSLEITFEDMFDLEDIQTLQDQVARLLGVASVIVRPDGSPITAVSNLSHFCALIRTTDKGREMCRVTNEQIAEKSRCGPYMQPCVGCGLWDGGASIYVKGKPVATWLLGQVRDESAGEGRISGYARDLGLDPDRVLEHYRAVPVMSRQTFFSTIQLIHSFVNFLSQTAVLNMEGSDLRQKLSRKDASSDLILNSLEEGVLTLDNELRIIGMNESAQTITGWIWEEAKGKACPLIMVLRDEKKGREFYASLLSRIKEGKRFRTRGNCVLESKGGETSLVRLTLTPLVMGNGEKGGVITIKDMTGEYRLQEQLYHSQKMENFGFLASGIAHDFNNVVNGLQMAAELLERERDDWDEESLSYVTMIRKGLERVKGLTVNLKSFCRREESLEHSLDLKTLCGEAVELLSLSVNKKIRITFEEDSPEFCRIMGNESAIQSLLMNLGINACHAVGREGNVRFRLYSESLDEASCRRSPFMVEPGGYCVVEVSDDGKGIPPEVGEKIFEPFFTMKGKSEGTGLGLSSVHRTVIDHRGQILWDSEEGKGTRFRIFLPSFVEAEEASSDESAAVREGRGHILLVDDEADNRDLGKNLLSRLGYEVETAENGEVALRMIGAGGQPFDVVLLDLLMPRVDGYEVLEALVRSHPDLRIIIISGFVDYERIRKLDRGDSLRIISKPYSIKELGEALAQIIPRKG